MKPNSLTSTILVTMLCLSGVSQQAQAQQAASASSKTDSTADAVSRFNSSTLLGRMWRGRRPGFSLMPGAAMRVDFCSCGFIEFGGARKRDGRKDCALGRHSPKRRIAVGRFDHHPVERQYRHWSCHAHFKIGGARDDRNDDGWTSSLTAPCRRRRR